MSKRKLFTLIAGALFVAALLFVPGHVWAQSLTLDMGGGK